MSIIYQTTVTDLATTDIDLTNISEVNPTPVPPAGTGWTLVDVSVGRTKVYYTWMQGKPVPNVGVYGSSITTPQITVDALGNITSIAETDILNGNGVTDQLAIWNGTSSLSGLNVGTNLSVINGTLNVVDIGLNFLPITGSSAGMSTTTSTSYQTKILLSPILVAGIYIIEWYYEWYYTSTSRNFESKIFLDSDIIATNIQRPRNSDSNQRHPASGFIIKTVTAGLHQIKLAYKSSSSSDTAGIINAQLKIQQIG